VRLDEDTRLMVRAAEGDSAAFERLYEKYLPVVTTYLVSLNGCDAAIEDLVQEVFMRLWQNRRQFRGDSTIKTYILGIVKNVLADHQRQLSKQKVAPDGLFLEYVAARSNARSRPDAALRGAEIKRSVEQGILKLTAKQRQAIRLFYYQEMPSLRAMANCANCSIEAFRSCLRQARRNLRQFLSNLEP
jgi:RNA polymerase sigma-70 factor (ECF subfamily)